MKQQKLETKKKKKKEILKKFFLRSVDDPIEEIVKKSSTLSKNLPTQSKKLPTLSKNLTSRTNMMFVIRYSSLTSTSKAEK